MIARTGDCFEDVEDIDQVRMVIPRKRQHPIRGLRCLGKLRVSPLRDFGEIAQTEVNACGDRISFLCW